MKKKKTKINTNPWFTGNPVDFNKIRRNQTRNKNRFYKNQQKTRKDASRGLQKLSNDLQKRSYKKSRSSNSRRSSIAKEKPITEIILSWFDRLSLLWKIWILANPIIVGIFILASTHDNLNYTKILFICYSVFWLFSPLIILYINNKCNIVNIKPSYFKSLQTRSNVTGYIYAIKVGTDMPGFIALKIGKTIRTPEDRLTGYQTGNPYSSVIKKWKCYGNLTDAEKYAHSIARQYARHYKSEVFYFDDKESIGHVFENISLDMNLKDDV